MRIEIGLPFTPAKFLAKEIKDGYAIEISCGGGVGGSRWTEVTLDDVPSQIADLSSGFIKANTDRGAGKIIGKRFIVSVRPVKIALMKIENAGNENCAQGTFRLGYALDSDSEIAFRDECQNRLGRSYEHILEEDVIELSDDGVKRVELSL